MRGIPFVVPFGFDGAADRTARAWLSSRAWGGRACPGNLEAGGPGAHFDIENLPGEGGLLGVLRANELARARRPVLLLGTPTTHILLPERLGDEARVDDAFVPIAELASAPNVLLVSPRLGVRTVEELVERARHQRLTYASAGAGQTIHVCTALFCEEAGIAMDHRPYDKGSATAYEDLLAGRVHVFFDNLLACRERIERGDVLMLAESPLDVWLGVFGAHLDPGLLDPRGSERFARRIEASRVDWRRALVAARQET